MIRITPKVLSPAGLSGCFQNHWPQKVRRIWSKNDRTRWKFLGRKKHFFSMTISILLRFYEKRVFAASTENLKSFGFHYSFGFSKFCPISFSLCLQLYGVNTALKVPSWKLVTAALFDSRNEKTKTLSKVHAVASISNKIARWLYLSGVTILNMKKCSLWLYQQIWFQDNQINRHCKDILSKHNFCRIFKKLTSKGMKLKTQLLKYFLWNERKPKKQNLCLTFLTLFYSIRTFKSRAWNKALGL